MMSDACSRNWRSASIVCWLCVVVGCGLDPPLITYDHFIEEIRSGNVEHVHIRDGDASDAVVSTRKGIAELNGARKCLVNWPISNEYRQTIEELLKEHRVTYEYVPVR